MLRRIHHVLRDRYDTYQEARLLVEKKTIKELMEQPEEVSSHAS